MVVDAQELTGENFLILHIFLSADLTRKEEPNLIEDEKQEHQNNKNILNRQGQQWPCFFYVQSIIPTYHPHRLKVYIVGDPPLSLSEHPQRNTNIS